MQSGARVQPGHTTAWLSEFCSATVSLLGACHACKSVVPIGAASTKKRAAGISSGVQRRTQFCACWSAGGSAAVLPGVREHRCALSQADFLNHRLTDWRAVEWPLSEMRSQQRRFQAATAPAAAIGCQLEGKTRRQLLRILLHAFALLAVAASAAATHYPIVHFSTAKRALSQIRNSSVRSLHYWPLSKRGPWRPSNAVLANFPTSTPVAYTSQQVYQDSTLLIHEHSSGMRLSALAV